MTLQIAIGAVLGYLISGGLALLLSRHPRWQRTLAFALLSAGGILSIAGGGLGLIGTTQTQTAALGLPWLPWHLRLDALSAFFSLLLGLVTLPAALYGFGYCREYDQDAQRRTPLYIFTGLFVGGMQLLLLADDAFSFMIAWETMSLASYFLVAFHHQRADARRAAFLYLLMAQAGGLAILLAFGVLATFGHGYDFTAMRLAALPPGWAALAFALAFIGFGTKAGLVPLHIWLPEAHPVAPSHISALLSGVIVKMALYGFIRVTFDLIGNVQWQWGVAVLLAGAVTALYGVLYALVQSDFKRLLAYSTIENIGIIFLALGLSIIYLGSGHPLLGALAFVASLYHALNHACFKGLLFLGAGAVLHNTHETNLERLGGLMTRMPWTGFLVLIGCLSISSLPPFNGFASEWLTFQSALQAGALESGVLRASIPMAAAVLALTAALSAMTFVKAFGVGFLGLPRSPHARHAREVNGSMRLGQGLLALLCLLLGVFPTLVVTHIAAVSRLLLQADLPSATAHGWLWLTPLAADKASYSAPLVFTGMLIAVAVWVAVYLLLRPRRQQEPVPRVPAWDCGFGGLTPRTQYSASAFSMPIQRIFRSLWYLEETTRESKPTFGIGQPAYPRYDVRVHDWIQVRLYEPIGQWVLAAAKRIGALQTGHLRHYLLYSLLTLVLLLWLLQ
ncbi:hydrogenase 4 subunit B [Mangrovitalea sediminis]|uniref:hydrogenase 4 subunit B n=1 Tax=Mangrovitalea sediminis TaxID=1982043 RepID=UPI000BE57E30|nr:hydrogenase 4 subunit B [Mangrovitalea sediminis]